MEIENSAVMPEPSHEAIVCLSLPMNVNSNGAWMTKQDSPLFRSLPLLHLQIALIFLVTQAIHFVLKRFQFSNIVSQILAGIILGNSLLILDDGYREYLLPITSQEILGTLSMFGYVFFLFLNGLKMDLTMIPKTGKMALAVGVLALVGPLLVNMISVVLLNHTLLQQDAAAGNVFVAANLPFVAATTSTTAFPVVASLLSELKILNSELGRIALSAATVTDLLTVFLSTVINISKMTRYFSFKFAGANACQFAAFIIFAIYFLRPVMFWVIRQTPEGSPVKDVYIYSIIIWVLICGLITNSFGQLLVMGCYIMGMVIPEGPPLATALGNKLDTIVSGVLMPVFITTCAMRTDLFSTFSPKNPGMDANVVLIGLSFAAKIIACMIPPLVSGMPLKDALALAFIMSAKGAVEMGHYTLLKDGQNIKIDTFSVMVITTLLASSLVPALVRWLYDPSRKYAGYQKRNIMHLETNEEFLILVCIFKSDNITSMINLLHASSPTTERPIAIYVLHLIELFGRASPLFISHQLQKKSAFGQSYSNNVISAFNHFEKNHEDAVVVQAFTAVSPPRTMHEDICTLALDKRTHLLLTPFHKKWTPNGQVEYEDRDIRTLNCSVLDIAPCSVGILVDRGRGFTSLVSSRSLCRVAVIFLGGGDDREALTYAMRMARGTRISLTVVHLIAAALEDGDTSNWDQMLDSQVLDDFKNESLSNPHVDYSKKELRDGSQTVLILKVMVDDYDLIIVGRRHKKDCPLTSCFSEWTEFPELGPIGDLLASTDIESKTSVLVIKQQDVTKQ